MTSFHPTLTCATYSKVVFSSFNLEKLEAKLDGIFPEHTVVLTDSGTSALALIIETLELKGKRMALPAYLCNTILPVLEHYAITPIFLDIDPQTLQPKVESYTDDLIEKCDAVLLVATFGLHIQDALYTKLKSANKILIEDFAHIPLPQKEAGGIIADARYYSLPKILPVPDGGIAVYKKSNVVKLQKNKKPIILQLKSFLKLFAPLNALVFHLRSNLGKGVQNTPRWNTVREASATTKKILLDTLSQVRRINLRYCYPLSVNDPDNAQTLLRENGIATERLWGDPIINAAKNQSPEDYPNTLEASGHVLCAPGWHVASQEEEREFKNRLKEILSSEFRSFLQ